LYTVHKSANAFQNGSQHLSVYRTEISNKCLAKLLRFYLYKYYCSSDNVSRYSLNTNGFAHTAIAHFIGQIKSRQNAT